MKTLLVETAKNRNGVELRENIASRSEAVMVAVGFSPRTGRNESVRRVATLENSLPRHQALRRDSRPAAAPPLRSAVAAVGPRVVRSTSTAVTALLLWATGVHAAPATTNEPRWGEAVGGLHMAASVEPRSGFVYCWLRNASTNEITYNRCFLGSWEAVGIEYHNGTEWRRLARATNESRFYEGIGPTLGQLGRLPPLQVITNCPHGISWADARFGPSIAITNGGRAGWTRKPRTELPRPSSLGATFTVDIGDFDWPAGVLATASEIRVFQGLSGPGHDAPIMVRSPPVILERRAIQDFLARLRHEGD